MGRRLPLVVAVAFFRFQRFRDLVAVRFFARRKMIELTKEKGIGWLARTLTVMAGLREDAEIAGRYRAREGAPPGSLGRTYFEFIRGNEFSFPGERGSPPEAVAFHDLTHVLSGYGTDPSGELQVLAFHAGCRREEHDPFSFLMFGIAEFHLEDIYSIQRKHTAAAQGQFAQRCLTIIKFFKIPAHAATLCGNRALTKKISAFTRAPPK